MESITTWRLFARWPRQHHIVSPVPFGVKINGILRAVFQRPSGHDNPKRRHILSRSPCYLAYREHPDVSMHLTSASPFKRGSMKWDFNAARELTVVSTYHCSLQEAIRPLWGYLPEPPR